jgi:cytochrome c biogenesis protein CcmG, thiol:disulfide interchange protein DsbE
MSDSTTAAPLPVDVRPARTLAAWQALLLAAVGLAAMIAVNVAYKEGPDQAVIARMTRTQAAPSRWMGRLAPDLTLPTLDGRPYRLADDVGKRVVVLNFFATWCGPCRAEMPELERYQRRAGDSVRLVGVDAQESPDLVRGFIAQMKTTFPIVIDVDGSVLKRYGVDSFPTTVVIGANGQIVLYEIGMIANADVSLRDIVAREHRIIASGQGIPTERYRTALLRQQPTPSPATQPAATSTSTPTPTLSGRAAAIAAAMPCPCGCDDQKVAACTCRTARAIKTRLAAGGFFGKTDAAVMEALNREFCMKGM